VPSSPPGPSQEPYALGALGKSCDDACSSAGLVCNDASHGSRTYGRDIVFGAMRRHGLEQNGDREDEWQNNLRVRDNYTHGGGEFRAVPGIWIYDNGKAAPDWKNAAYTGMPSTCGAVWGGIRRVCACEKPAS